MKYINSSFEEINIDEKLCLTIGNFDGIHIGHREIIKNLIQKTKISKFKSAILSFTPHPKIYFKKQNNFMINSQLKKKERDRFCNFLKYRKQLCIMCEKNFSVPGTMD